MDEPERHITTQQQLRVLQDVPQSPRRVARPRNWPLALQSVADYVTHAHRGMARVRGIFSKYPKPFRKVEIASQDGTLLSAWLGVHTDADTGQAVPREGIVVVPGMFSTKDMAIQKARVLKIFRDYGYHVLAMDLRGFGDSSRVANTAGWKEAEDVLAGVQHMRDHVPLTRLHIYSESMGATAALLAAADAAERGGQLIDGALLAVSPYADAEQELEHLDRVTPLGDDYYMVNWFFRQLLRLSGHPVPTFRRYLEQSAEAYGTTLEDLLRRSSPQDRLEAINVPTLVLLSDDDIVVPFSQVMHFEEAFELHPMAAFWRLPWGNHCLYEMMDAQWFWTVLSEFFGFYCVLPPRGTDSA